VVEVELLVTIASSSDQLLHLCKWTIRLFLASGTPAAIPPNDVHPVSGKQGDDSLQSNAVLILLLPAFVPVGSSHPKHQLKLERFCTVGVNLCDSGV